MRTAIRLALGLVLACGGAQTSAAHENTDGAPVVDIVVTSGLPQPAPKEASVSVGAPLTLRVEGLGPARASVIGPDGSTVTTTDAPLTRDGKGTVVGTEQRFTPQAAGVYRVVLAEAPSTELARVVAH